MSLKAGDWAAWVQAIMSVAAICAGFVTVYWQMRKADQQRERENQQRERDRDDRAKVVAVRLSVWLEEIDALITDKLERFKELASEKIEIKWVSPEQRDTIKMNVSRTIEDVMSDLHYLRKGSSDVAQLHSFIKEFDTYIDKIFKGAVKDQPVSLNPIVRNEIERRLMNLKQLCADASRHLDPIIQDAVRHER
jgi:hypothetical protein